MRKSFIPVLGLVALAGCQSADNRFDKSFEIAGGGRERCAVSLEAQDYFLRAGDAEHLEKWRSKGAYDCLSSGMSH